ncbi:MAG TPA: DUF2842 domain-containing protein [Terricaulis sp.]|nr:DUF2842 domain-containing protein [Terricaulis sp.]
MQMRARKALGCLVLLAYLAAYAALAAALGAYLVQIFPWWAQLLYFAAAGVVWIFPLKPLFAWMNRGA